MKAKTKRNLLMAGAAVTGVGSIVASVAMDEYIKKNLNKPNSILGNIVRLSSNLTVLGTGLSVAMGLAYLADNAEDDYIADPRESEESSDEYDESDESDIYDEDFDQYIDKNDSDITEEDEDIEKHLLTKIDVNSETENQPETTDESVSNEISKSKVSETETSKESLEEEDAEVIG